MSIVLFYVLFVCKCVLYYCHRVTTQLQFNKYIISYHIERDHLVDLIGVGGRIMVNLILKKSVCRARAGLIWLRVRLIRWADG